MRESIYQREISRERIASYNKSRQLALSSVELLHGSRAYFNIHNLVKQTRSSSRERNILFIVLYLEKDLMKEKKRGFDGEGGGGIDIKTFRNFDTNTYSIFSPPSSGKLKITY